VSCGGYLPKSSTGGVAHQSPFLHAQPSETSAISPADLTVLQAEQVALPEGIAEALAQAFDYIIGFSSPTRFSQNAEYWEPVVLLRQERMSGGPGPVSAFSGTRKPVRWVSAPFGLIEETLNNVFGSILEGGGPAKQALIKGISKFNLGHSYNCSNNS
jgi:hypothetical protein